MISTRMSLDPRMRILLTGLLFATGGAAIKACSLPGPQISAMRAVVAALTLFLLLPEARRLPSWRVLLVLPAYFGSTFLFVVANKLTTAANAIFLQATAPLWVALLGPLLLGEKPKRSEWFALGCIAAGMGLFFLAEEDASAIAIAPLLGNVLAVVSGVSFGLLLIGFRWLGKRGEGEQGAVVAWGNLFTACCGSLVMVALDMPFGVPSPTDWTILVALGSVQVGCSYALLVRSMPLVPAVQASLLLMIEPALNPLFAYLAHGERPHPMAVAGGALIVGAVTVSTLLARKRN